MMNLTQLLRGRQIGTLMGLVGLSTILWVLSPYFLTVSNIINVAQQTSIIAIVSVGMTFVIISGGIDLSVGSIVAISGLFMASSLHANMPLSVAVLVALMTGLLWGCINGLLITFGALPPFIATLGTMSVARGLALMYTDGGPISGFSDTFRGVATGEIYDIPAPVIIMVFVYLTAHSILMRTKLGRYAYAIGGNEQAAILSGVNVRFYKTMIYGLCGMLSGLSAVILTARLNSAQPIAGVMYELDAIAAAVIGGTSLMGGKGTAFGTLLGALIIGVLRNGLNLLDVSSYVQQVAIGSVIIAAVFIDMILKRKKIFT